jgi:hypothetical protein
LDSQDEQQLAMKMDLEFHCILESCSYFLAKLYRKIVNIIQILVIK